MSPTPATPTVTVLPIAPPPTPDQLKPSRRPCDGCDGERWFFDYSTPPGFRRPAAGSFGLLAPLMDFHRGLCRSCHLRRQIGRLMPPDRTVPIVTDPAQQGLAALAAMVRPPAGATDPTPEGARFKFDFVLVTEAASLAVGFSLADAHDVIGTGSNRTSNPKIDRVVARLGRKAIDGYLARFAAGDLGDLGAIADGDASKADVPPLARYADQAARAIRDGAGTVYGVYRFAKWQLNPRPDLAEVDSIRIWCELSPRGNLVLASVGRDGVMIDG